MSGNHPTFPFFEALALGIAVCNSLTNGLRSDFKFKNKKISGMHIENQSEFLGSPKVVILVLVGKQA